MGCAAWNRENGQGTGMRRGKQAGGVGRLRGDAAKGPGGRGQGTPTTWLPTPEGTQLEGAPRSHQAANRQKQALFHPAPN